LANPIKSLLIGYQVRRPPQRLWCEELEGNSKSDQGDDYALSISRIYQTIIVEITDYSCPGQITTTDLHQSDANAMGCSQLRHENGHRNCANRIMSHHR
jgi:hypothetical protein